MNSYEWVEPDFLVLPLSVLYKDFPFCQYSLLKSITDSCPKDVLQSKDPTGNESDSGLFLRDTYHWQIQHL